MRNGAWLLSASLILAGGCSQQGSNNAATSGDNGAAAANGAASAAAPTSQDFRLLAACSSKMEAVGRLYNAIATTSSGERGVRMLQLAGERELAASRFKFEAERIARAADPSGAAALESTVPEVDRIRSETAAAIEAERGRRPFEDFAVWLGREADRCAPLVPTAP